MKSLVYLVFDPFYISGGMRVIYEHVNRLVSCGNNVEIWSPHTKGVVHFRNRVNIKLYDPDKLNDPDAIVVCDPGFSNDINTHRDKGKVFFLMQHDSEWVAHQNRQAYAPVVAGPYKQLFLDKQWRLLVVSPWLKQVLQDRYELEATVIENGVDPDLFFPAKKPLLSHSPTVIVVFDPQPWKGSGDAVNSLMELWKRVPALEVIILSKVVLSASADAGYSFQFPFPVTIFCSPPQERLPEIYSSADVFLSMSELEGFGLPVLEAMACGVAVVTTDNGGNREFAVDGKTASIVSTNDAIAASDAVYELLTNRMHRQMLRGNGIRMAKQYSWNKSIRELQKTLQTPDV